MYGSHTTRSVRGFQRTYEDRALQYRRQIEFLIRERQLYQDQFQELQPTLEDDGPRLFHLGDTIRKTISELQQYTIDYNKAVEDWLQLGDECKIAEHRDSDDWARRMAESAAAFFEQPDLHPTSLDAQFVQLINDHRDLLDAVNDYATRLDPALLAGLEREASTPAEESPAASQHHAAGSSHRESTASETDLLSVTDHSSAAPRSDTALLAESDRGSPAQATSSPPSRQQVTINDDPRRHYYTDQSADSSTTGRHSLITIDAYPATSHIGSAPQPAASHRGVPIVQELDFGDNTTLSASPPVLDSVYRYSPHDWDTYASPGLMTYTNGNVAAASPMAWHSPQIGSPAQFTTYGPPGTNVLLTFGPGRSPAALLAAGTTVHDDTRPTRLAPPPPSSLPAPSTSHLLATNTTTLAGGRGPFSFFPSGPSTVDASSRPPPGPPAPAPTIKAHSEQESASAFYRNATFHRDTKTTQLVLKELPITPFDGNIRRYPMFRDRFLDVVEGHSNLPPRQKLQYLLQFLRGEPYELANNFQFTDANYYAVLDLLEERYGDKDMIRNLLMADLIELRQPSHTVSDLRRFHGEAYRVTTDLKQLGDDVDSNRLYEQTLMSKLSPALKMELIRNSDYVKEKTASSILTGLHRYIQLLDATANTGVLFSKMSMGDSCPPGGRTPPRSNSPRYSGPPGRRTPSRPSSPRQSSNTHHVPHSGYGAEAGNVPDADSRQNRTICAFCGLTHWAAQCTVFRTVAQRYRRARELKYCFLCLRGNHWIEKCPHRTTESCGFCGEPRTHHRALCRKAPSRTWQKGTPRHSPVRNQGPGASDAPGGSPGDPSVEKRHDPAKKAVRWTDSRDRESTAHGNVSPSTQKRQTQGRKSPGDQANSKKISRRKKSRSPGTDPQGRKGISRPTTASTAEDITTKGDNACAMDRFLSGLESLLSTVRCPPTYDTLQFDRAHDRAGSCASSAHDPDAVGHEQWDEDESYPNWSGHCSNAPSEPSDAVPEDYNWFLPYEEPTAFAVSASLPADTRTVLLECAKVTAVNPNTGVSREVTAFFDQGSTLSYVSTALANDLDLPQQGYRRLHVNTFGSSKPLLMEGFSTKLVLRSRRGHSVSLNATAAPDCIVKAVTTALVEDHELPSLMDNEVTLISTRETPDILIGQDTVQLFKRKVETRLPNGFDLIKTILGPMIGGAGRVANPTSKVDTTTLSVVDFSCPPGGTRSDNPLDGSAVQSIGRFPPPPPKSKFSTTPLPPSERKTDSVLLTESRRKPPNNAWNACSVLLTESCQETPEETTVFGYFSGLADKSDAEIFGDFSYLENAGIGTSEMTPDDQAAADMLEKLITREPGGRYKVPLLFRTADGEPPSNNDLPTNMNLGKGRGISTRNSLAKVPKKLAEYDGIIRDYKDRKFVSTAPLRTRQTKHCLSHHPVHKETSTTTATRPVYDASAKLPGRSSLNDWLYRGPVLLPTVPAVLLRSRLPKIIAVCDIGKAFLQVAVKESHRDCLWFVWFKDPTKEPTDDNVIFYRFDRVPFGLKSSPYLLAGVIKKHLESEGTPLAQEMLKNCYVDNVLLMADTVEEALQKYRESKAIFAKAQMPLREYASNDSKFNDSLDPADRADLNKLRELGIRWDVTADYWDIPLRPKPPKHRPVLLTGSVAATTAQSVLLTDPDASAKMVPPKEPVLLTDTFQALVQLSEANAAREARHSLDGRNVYNGGCTLRIDYSKLSTLSVKYNNDKSRDYTNRYLPSGELTFEQQLSLISSAAQGQLPGSLNTLVPSAFNFPLTAGTNTTDLQQQAFQTADDLSAANGQSNPLLPTLGTQLANGTNTAVGNALATALQLIQLGLSNLSPVVLVSNLNEAKVTPDALFTLFGVYGDVQRVKILFNNKDNALVQYSVALHTHLAIKHLDKVRWHDKVIRITTSKHKNVQMPKEGQSDDGLTRDYSDSSFHRFKLAGSKNYMNIYPPSSIERIERP